MDPTGSPRGLFRGTPPYPWRKWFVFWIACSAAFFVILEFAARFHHPGLNAILALAVGVVCVLCTRWRIIIMARRDGRLPSRES